MSLHKHWKEEWKTGGEERVENRKKGQKRKSQPFSTSPLSFGMKRMHKFPCGKPWARLSVSHSRNSVPGQRKGCNRSSQNRKSYLSRSCAMQKTPQILLKKGIISKSLIAEKQEEPTEDYNSNC